MVLRALRAGEQIFTKKVSVYPRKDLNVMNGGQLNTTIRPMTGSQEKDQAEQVDVHPSVTF